MKKMMFVAMMMTIAISASAMTYERARTEALFLSDKMAYELKLSDAQLASVYQINLNYLMGVNTPADAAGYGWDRRNADMRYVLSAKQYKKFVARSYFFRPLSWRAGAWDFSVYHRYADRNRFYYARPHNVAPHAAPAPPRHDNGAHYHGKPSRTFSHR